jgi:hypothetical protein
MTFYKLEGGKKMFFDFASNSYKPLQLNPKAFILADLRENNKVVKSVGSCSLIDLGDGVFDLEFHSKMNAINKEMVEFMMEAGEYVGKRRRHGHRQPGIRHARAFSAGGDLSYMLGLARTANFPKSTTLSAMSTRDHGHQICPVSRGCRASRPGPGRRMRSLPVGRPDGGPCRSVHGAGGNRRRSGSRRLRHDPSVAELYQRQPGIAKITDLAGLFIQAFMCVAQAKVSSFGGRCQKQRASESHRPDRLQQGPAHRRSQEGSAQDGRRRLYAAEEEKDPWSSAAKPTACSGRKCST